MKLKIFIKHFFETRTHFENRLNKFLENSIKVSRIDRGYGVTTFSVYYEEC